MIDITNEYAKMIKSFECGFSQEADPERDHRLDEVQFQIEQHNERLIADIELLQKLSFGMKTGSLRIVYLAGWDDEAKP